MTSVRGMVINVHGHGATVRLDDGSLAAIPSAELAAHRPAFVASLQKRTILELALEPAGRHRVAFLANHANRPAISLQPAASDRLADVDEADLEDGEIVRTLRLVDDAPASSDALFEHRIANYLKSTEEWAPADRPAPDERNLLRKKKRAAFFESRTSKRPPPV